MTRKELHARTTLHIPHEGIEQAITQSLEETLSEIYEALDITTGDTHPCLVAAWDMHVHDLAHIFEQLIAYNLVIQGTAENITRIEFE